MKTIFVGVFCLVAGVVIGWSQIPGITVVKALDPETIYVDVCRKETLGL